MPETHNDNLSEMDIKMIDETNIQNTENSQTPLVQWGVEDAANQMGWLEKKLSWHDKIYNGYVYPLYHLNGKIQTDTQGDPISRWKNTGGSDPKNLWLGGKPDNCLPLYFPPNIDKAIEEAGGQVHLVEGEKDVLSMMAAGYDNVITWTDGATSIPPELPEALQLLGVDDVIHLPDLDEAGRKSVTKMQAILEPLRIAYKAITLPAKLGEKGDVNDWWCACGHDANKFRDELEQYCQTSIMVEQSAEPIIQQKTRPMFDKNYHGDNEVPDDFIRDIESALGVTKYKRNGFSNDVCCPFHDDNNPSAGWHKDKHILKCFACGDFFLAKKVGAKLGIDIRNYHQSIPVQNTSDKPTAAQNAPLQNVNTITNDDTTMSAPTNDGGKASTPTDDEVGDAIIEQWDGQYAYLYNAWYRYDNGVWQNIETVDEVVWDTMKTFKGAGYKPSESKKKSVVGYLKAKLGVPTNECDQGDDYINMQNGLFNLETGELEPHQRDLYLTHQLPFDYTLDTDCERWKQFLREVLQDEGKIGVLQEAMGYSLTADTHHEKMVWLNGKAATGKSTILKVLAALMGSAAGTLDLSALRTNPYQLAHIPGKRVVTCSEATVGGVLHDSTLKSLVSGEDMLARQIYNKNFTFKPRAKVWWAMNEIPTTLDRSDAIFRRLILINLEHPVPPEKRDVHLFDKLRDELPGIFIWALEGLNRLRANGAFSNTASIEEAVAKYQQDNDVEAVFLADEEWIELDDTGSVRGSDLHLAYKAWCEMTGEKAKSRTLVARDWKRLNIEKARISEGVRYLGISLTTQAQNVVKTVRQNKGQNRS